MERFVPVVISSAGDNDPKPSADADSGENLAYLKAKRTVLIANGDATLLKILLQRCAALGLKVEGTTDGLDALMLAVQNSYALIVLDSNLPGLDGLGICDKLASCGPDSTTPILLLTGNCDQDTIRRCAAANACYVYKGQDVWSSLEPVICETLDLESKSSEAPTDDQNKVTPTANVRPVPMILVIDDDALIVRALIIRLGALGFQVIGASNGSAGATLANLEKPDLIITDQNMPEVSGERLILNLKARRETKDIPIIMLTGASVGGKIDYALKREVLGRRGAAAYLSKPLDYDALLRELRRHVHFPDPAKLAESNKQRI